MPKRVPVAVAGLETRDLSQSSLCFDSRTDSRIITPAPEGWRTLTDSLLEDLLSHSKRLKPR